MRDAVPLVHLADFTLQLLRHYHDSLFWQIN